MLTMERIVSETFPKFIRVEGVELICTQFVALFLKRFNTIKREWWMPLFLFVLPIFLTLFFCRLDEWAYSTESESVCICAKHPARNVERT